MSFTGQLGTSNSMLGNIELGSGSSLSLDLTISIDVIAAVTVSPGGTFSNSFSINAVAAIARQLNETYSDSLTIAGFSALVGQNGVFDVSITVAGISIFDGDTGFKYFSTLTVAAIASITKAITSTYSKTVSVPGISSIGTDLTSSAILTVSLAGVSFIDETDAYNLSELPAGISSISSSSQATFLRNVSQTLALTQNITWKYEVTHANQHLTFVQHVTFKHIHNPNITQTLSFSQVDKAFRNINTTLHIAQTVSHKKIRSLSVSHTLHLVQTVHRNTLTKYTVTQTFIFNPIRDITSPLITDYGRFIYQQSSIVVSVINQSVNCSCSVTLQSNNTLIVLPCPQFGDTQNYSGTMNLKRTMTGDTYTYVKKSRLNKLKYTFFCGREKGLELRSFLYQNSHKVITLTNWKGEIWHVNIINNPFEFTISQRYQKEQERSDVTLEFEGVKLT